VSEVVRAMVASSRSLGMVMTVSTHSRSSSRPRSAWSCRFFPSNLKGFVTTAIVSAPIDFATSATAEGKVRVARNKGVAIPPDCLVDAEGNPSTDPNDLYTDPPGSLLPFGGAVSGHKGGALWLMVDLLAGAFTGGGCSRPAEGAPRFTSNMLSIVIAPEVYTGASELAAEIRRYLAFVKSSRPRTEGGAVMLPGEPEQRARTGRLARGIPIDATTWDQIMAAGEGLGLVRADLEAMV